MLHILLTCQAFFRPPATRFGIRRCTNVACAERDGIPQSDVAELLELLSSLHVDRDDGRARGRRPPSLARTIGTRQPTGSASELSTDAVAQRGKRLLAQPTPAELRQEEIASLAHEALAAGRPHSAQLAYELAARRLSKWRVNNESLPVVPALVRAGLLASVELRARDSYETVLANAQTQWDVELAADDSLLSAAMVRCCDAGWVHHASAINLTLSASGLTPSCEAANAWLLLLLRSGNHDGAIDAFLDMKQRGPRPDQTTHALAARAAATRKSTWSGLRNLMRRPKLKIKWNALSANAALGAYISAGNLQAAAGVAGHMAQQRTRLRLDSYEALLEYASSTCRCGPTSRRVFAALEAHAAASAELARGQSPGGMDDADDDDDEWHVNASPPTLAPLCSAATVLLMLPHLPSSERIGLCARALEGGGVLGADEVRLQSALALLDATDGRGEEAATWLLRLHAEGAGLSTVDSDGALALSLELMTPPALRHEPLSLASLLDDRSSSNGNKDQPPALAIPKDDDLIEEGMPQPLAGARGPRKGRGRGRGNGARGRGGRGGGRGRTDTTKAAAPPSTPPFSPRRRAQALAGTSVWILALRACGANVDAAEAITSAMEGCGEIDLPAGVGVDAMLEYLRVCGRARDPHAALVGLRKLGPYAPAEAFVCVLITICTDEQPNMGFATTTLDMMQKAGALKTASAGQLLRLYVALVSGYGTSQLEEAHEAFEEATEWLDRAQQQQLVRTQRAAELEAEARPADTAAVDVLALGMAGASDGKEAAEWGEREWLAAERALHRVMVEAAAPHPRGLLLACTLLEQMQRNSGQRLKNGYYTQLINGHATAHELHIAVGSLTTSVTLNGVSSSGWRVSDATIAALMEAIDRRQADLAEAVGSGDEPGLSMAEQLGGADRRRATALKSLSDAGLAMDRKVAEYLASGDGGMGRSRVRRPVNPNDDIARSERGGRAAPTGTYDANAARRVARAATSEEDYSQPLSKSSAKEQYSEFDKLLAQREEPWPSPSDPKPDRDTKRAVDARRLRNLGNL